jgi:hypothetical protein
LKLAWWNWDIEKTTRYLKHLTNTNIDELELAALNDYPI